MEIIKKSIKCVFVFSVLFFNSNCSVKQLPPYNDWFSVEAYSPVFPVLIGKENNPVFRINLQRKIEQPLTINSIEVNLKGTLSLEDIKKVTIYYTEAEKDFSTGNVFAESTSIATSFTIRGKQALKNGNNYFWLSLSLHDDIDIDYIISPVISKVKVNQAMVTIPKDQKNIAKRLGHALRQHQDDGVHTYRIPGLATTLKGTLIAVYDLRRNSSVDLQEDIDIGMSRSTDGGQSWEPMKVIIDMGEWGGRPEKENGIGDPAVLIDRQTNTIWVAGVWAHGHPGERNWFASGQGLKPEQTSQFILVKSEDDGLTWSEPINITEQIKHPNWHLLLQGPGKGITMDDGTLVFPAQFKDENEVPHSTIIYSKDRGETWTIGTGAKSKTTESQVVELSDHSLMLNMRDDRGNGPNGRTGSGARSVVITKDLGESWNKHSSSRKALPEPVCMASLIKHSIEGKDLLLFSNPADQYLRHNMTIKISEDEGLTWNENYYTLIDEGRGFGYSCMTTIDEYTIGILYEGSQAHMVFQRIKLSDLYEKIPR